MKFYEVVTARKDGYYEWTEYEGFDREKALKALEDAKWKFEKYSTTKEKENEYVKFLENYIDEMNSAITGFLQKCSRLPNANHDDRKHFNSLLHVTDTLENLSDETCSLMHTVKKYVSNENYDLNSQRSKEIEDYLEKVKPEEETQDTPEVDENVARAIEEAKAKDNGDGEK